MIFTAVDAATSVDLAEEVDIVGRDLARSGSRIVKSITPQESSQILGGIDPAETQIQAEIQEGVRQQDLGPLRRRHVKLPHQPDVASNCADSILLDGGVFRQVQQDRPRIDIHPFAQQPRGGVLEFRTGVFSCRGDHLPH